MHECRSLVLSQQWLLLRPNREGVLAQQRHWLYSALRLTGVYRHYVGNRVSFRTLPLNSLGLSVCNQIVSIRPVALCTLIGSVRGLVK